MGGVQRTNLFSPEGGRGHEDSYNDGDNEGSQDDGFSDNSEEEDKLSVYRSKLNKNVTINSFILVSVVEPRVNQLG